MFETWLAVATTLGAVVAYASSYAERKRLRVAGYLSEIAQNLEAMADAAEEGRKFTTHCIKLRTATRKLYEVCQGVTSAADLRQLAEQLNFAAASPGTLSQRDRLAALTGEEKEQAIDALREAAALVGEHAAALRAM